MVTVSKLASSKDVAEGTLFCIPLPEKGGFGFGYIALYRKRWGYLYHIYDHISNAGEIPTDIEQKQLIIKDLLGSSVQFIKTKNNQAPWIPTATIVKNRHNLENTRFLIGSKVVDILTDEKVEYRHGDDDTYPDYSLPLGSEWSYLVEARLRRCDYRFNTQTSKFELIDYRFHDEWLDHNGHPEFVFRGRRRPKNRGQTPADVAATRR